MFIHIIEWTCELLTLSGMGGFWTDTSKCSEGERDQFFFFFFLKIFWVKGKEKGRQRRTAPPPPFPCFKELTYVKDKIYLLRRTVHKLCQNTRPRPKINWVEWTITSSMNTKLHSCLCKPVTLTNMAIFCRTGDVLYI